MRSKNFDYVAFESFSSMSRNWGLNWIECRMGETLYYDSHHWNADDYKTPRYDCFIFLRID
jgi:hypothetical protein